MAWKLFKLTKHTSFAALPALVEGALMYITDEDAICFHNGSAWERVLSTTVNNENAAVPTSAATAYAPIARDSAGRAQVASPSADSDIATKGYVHPVGSYYVQYPDASSNTDSTEFPTSQRPATLFGGTWAEQWSTESVYFRTRGTLSDTGRTNGLQDSALQGHDHKLWAQDVSASGSNMNRIRADSGLVSIDAARTSGYHNIATWASNTRLMSGYSEDNSANGTPKVAAETRVVNRRIKIWKRTA